jgi:hypothetical protein
LNVLLYLELALVSMYKMLKPGGVILATAPRTPKPVAGEKEFDMVGMIWDCDLFNCDQIAKEDEQIRFKLEKIG